MDASAAPGGDGRAEAPFRTLEDALAAADGAPAEIRLAAGDYRCPGPVGGALVLIGAGADTTRLSGGEAACVSADGTGLLTLAHLMVHTDQFAVAGRDLSRLRVRDARLRGPNPGCGAEGASAGLVIEGVNTAELLRAEVSQMALAHVVALASGLSIKQSAVGPGAGPGVRAGAADLAEDCAAARSPVCPYAAYVHVESTLIEGVGERGIEAEQAVVQVERVRVTGVGTEGATPRARGVRLIQSQAQLTRGTEIESVAGIGLAADSARLYARDLRVRDAEGGGVQVERLPPAGVDAIALRPFPVLNGGAPFYPEPWTRPPPEWASHPSAFAGEDGYPEPWTMPGGDELPGQDALPAALQRTGAKADVDGEGDLHRWARARLEGLYVERAGRFGVRLSGHAAYLDAPVIRGTRGERSAGLLVSQRSLSPVEAEGASVVALSQVSGATIEGGEADGVVVASALLLTRPEIEDDLRVSLDHRVGIADSEVRDNAGVGISLIESASAIHGVTVTNSRAIGIWLAGAIATLTDNVVRDTRAGEIAGRDGIDEIGDGVVIQGTELWTAYTADLLQWQGNQITGSDRAGLLIVSDRFPVGGSLRLQDADFNDNGRLSAGAIGDTSALDLPGDLPLVPVTPQDFAPPAEPMVSGE